MITNKESVRYANQTDRTKQFTFNTDIHRDTSSLHSLDAVLFAWYTQTLTFQAPTARGESAVKFANRENKTDLKVHDVNFDLLMNIRITIGTACIRRMKVDAKWISWDTHRREHKEPVTDIRSEQPGGGEGFSDSWGETSIFFYYSLYNSIPL